MLQNPDMVNAESRPTSSTATTRARAEPVTRTGPTLTGATIPERIRRSSSRAPTRGWSYSEALAQGVHASRPAGS
jgi:hypothetical protein